MRVARENRGGDQARQPFQTIVSPILPWIEGRPVVDLS
jgi:hypothetical protein